MALYTIDRINRLRAHLGVSPETPFIGGHTECDKIDAILGIDTTGGIRRRHWQDIPANPVGLRVAKLEVYCFGPRRNPITAAFWAPQGLYHHWLGVEG